MKIRTKNIGGNSLVLNELPKYFLIFSVCILVLFLGYMVLPFFTAVLLSAIIATGLYPMYEVLCKYVKLKSLAGVISVIIVLLIFLAPLSWFLFHISDQALNIYKAIEPKVSVLLDVNILPEKLHNTKLGEYLDKFKVTSRV